MLQVERDRLVMQIGSIQNGNPLDEVYVKSDKVKFLTMLNFTI